MKHIFDAHMELDTCRSEESSEEILNLMDLGGVERAVVVPGATVSDDADFSLANRAVLEFCGRHKERLIPFCRLQPKLGSKALDQMTEEMKSGHKGLFLYPDSEQFYVDHCVDLFRLLDPNEFPVMMIIQKHMVRHPRHWQGVIQKFPNIPVIFSHAGQDDYVQAVEMAAEFSNVYLETGALDLYKTRKALTELDEKKILFASGYPRSDARIEKTKLTEVMGITSEMIYSKNAERILKL